MYHNNGREWKRIKEQHIVDLKDITSTGFSHVGKISYIIRAVFCVLLAIGIILNEGAGVLAAVLLIACFISIGLYFLKRITLFKMTVGGCEIAFDTKWIAIQTMFDFQRKIHQQKAKI